MKTPYDLHIEYCLQVVDGCNEAMRELQTEGSRNTWMMVFLFTLTNLCGTWNFSAGNWIFGVILILLAAVVLVVGLWANRATSAQIQAAHEMRMDHLYCAEQYKRARAQYLGKDIK